MKRSRVFTITCFLMLAVALTAPLPAVEGAARSRHGTNVERLIGAARVEDLAKAERASLVLIQWLDTLASWHAQHDAALNERWTQWNKARAVVPKDEFPAEVIAHQIDDVYASLKPAYAEFQTKLSAVLSPEEIDAIKEQWSRSPGMRRTYHAFLEIAPDLTDVHKKVIYARMERAREDAMLTDSSKEIIDIFKRHKVKVEAYIGSLEWAKLHRAFANRGRANEGTK
jgi:hypothetical protein